MSDPTATPRITAQYLEQFAHQNVRILGKVQQLRGESATIDSGGQISIHLNRDAHLQLNHVAEIIGKVQNDLSVRVMTATDFGPEGTVDFGVYEAVVDATLRYREIFYTQRE